MSEAALPELAAVPWRKPETAGTLRNGLVPVLCLGETERLSTDAAGAEVIRQLESALADAPAGRVIIAYEPVWAIGAPEPLREIPVTPSRMIHFLDFSNEKMVAKAGDIAKQTDILLGNLEDAIPVDRKEAARAGLIKAARESDFGATALWTRVNSLESPWVLDDLTEAA